MREIHQPFKSMINDLRLVSTPTDDPEIIRFTAGSILSWEYEIFAFYDDDYGLWRVLTQTRSNAITRSFFTEFCYSASDIVFKIIEHCLPILKREMNNHLKRGKHD